MNKPISSRIYILFIIILVTIHAFLMNGHYHVHKQLTVGTYLDPIVAQADSTLLKNSVYVQAVKRTNVRFSISHAIHLYIIKHFDFETFAIVMGIVSLFCSLAGLFNLTQALFPGSGSGYIAMLLYTAELNNWTVGSPAPYLNFFHHSLLYAYPLIIWSMVYFFRKRYAVSLFLAGLSWNFHPMCAVFILWAYGLAWAFNYKDFRLATIGTSCIAFMVPALPTIIRGLNYLGSTQQLDLPVWITTVLWSAWYTCFPSTWPAPSFVRAILFFALSIIAIYTIPDVSRKRDLLIFICSVLILCLLGTIFVDIYPIPFIIKLSLWRSTVVYLFLALPCIAYYLTSIISRSIPRRFFVIALIVFLTGYVKCFPLYYLPLFMCSLLFFKYEDSLAKHFPLVSTVGLPILFITLAIMVVYHIMTGERGVRLLIFFSSTIIFLFTLSMLERRFTVSALAYPILFVLFVVLFDTAVLYFKGGLEIYYHGYFQGRRDPWADIQLYAQKHSAKDDLFIVPPYMNDFGIYSLRATLGDWAEGANSLYLDSQFAREWLSRMKDLGWKSFCVDSNAGGYFDLKTENVVKTAEKYGAKFIVTEKPKTFDLDKIYENEQFILYATAYSTH